MAIITAQAKFYNAFKCRVVDKNITANLSASFGASAIPVTVLRSDNNALRVNAGLSMTGSYAIKGGLIKGDQSMTVNSRLRLQFPTFVEIDWYKLEIPEGKNVTIQMEEGFVIEDRNKFPFALGSPLAFNGNLLSFRTPKRGFVTPFNSAFTLPNIVSTRVRFNQAALTSAFSPTLVGQLNRFGVIDLQSAFQQTTIAGKIKFFASQMLARFGPIGPGDLPYLEGNGFQFQTGLGFWPQGFPGITRIRTFESEFLIDSLSIIEVEKVKLSEIDTAAEFNLFSDVIQIKGPGFINLPTLTNLQASLRADYNVTLLLNSLSLSVVQAAKQTSTTSVISANSSLSLVDEPNLLAWGVNSSRQLGLGDTTNRSIPTFVVTGPIWDKVDGGGTHSLAITKTGELWSWGSNNIGQLGLGDTNVRTTLNQVGTASNWIQVSADSHSLAINSDGELWGWGSNSFGNLGLGDTTNRLIPTRIGTASNWIQVSAGGGYTLALNSNGELWACGSNQDGKTGLNTTTGSTLTLTRVGTASNWTKISASTNHSLAINSSGQLWAWGRNAAGHLGLGDTTLRSTPTQVGTASNWTDASSGTAHSLAINSSGQLWAWGSNFFGVTGLNTQTGNTLVPTQVGTASNWSQVNAANSWSLAITNNNQLWSWGSGAEGRNGLNTTDNILVPVRVGTASNWLRVGTGGAHSLAVIT
jgi:alpha-tubulin suppressor-like RCC1 family protein